MIKRAFDGVLSGFLVLVLSPFFLLIALLIRLDSPGPVFHRAVRAGKDFEPFTLYKFRTMVVGAPSLGPALTKDGDPRVTRVGHFLRKSKVDELPQLINVLKGDMSMVGPRPEDVRYVVHYSFEQRRLLGVRPGIASPASVRYRHEEEILAQVGGDLERTYLDVVMPDKLRIDLEYLERQCLWRDVIVLAQVALSLIAPHRRPGDDPVSSLT